MALQNLGEIKEAMANYEQGGRSSSTFPNGATAPVTSWTWASRCSIPDSTSWRLRNAAPPEQGVTHRFVSKQKAAAAFFSLLNT
jgi:hypothetical protein